MSSMLIHQGDFQVAERIIGKLSDFGELFDTDIARDYRNTLHLRLLLKKRLLDEALEEGGQAIAFRDKIGQKETLLNLVCMKVNLQILAGDLGGAGTALAEADTLFGGISMKLPFRISGYYLCHLLYEVTLLEHSLGSGNRAEAKRSASLAFSSGKLAVKNSRYTAHDTTEILRLMGTCSWLTGKRRKARRWWAKSIAVGERLGARPDLARTWLEIGKRLSGAERFGGLSSEQCLEKAETLFRELDLAWDLEQLEKVRRESR